MDLFCKLCIMLVCVLLSCLFLVGLAVVNCWERADLLAVMFVVFSCVLSFPNVS